MPTPEIAINTEAYSGPMELLVELIGKRKVFVNDISLAQVADDFIATLEDIEAFPVDTGSQFILIASTLVLIKSKSLLPHLQLTEDEQSDIHELEERLRLYTLYTNLASHIQERYGAEVSFPQACNVAIPVSERSVMPENVTPTSCLDALRNVVARTPTKHDIPQATVKKMVRLEDMIERLMQRVERDLRLSFAEFSGTSGGTREEQKHGVIVSFLAMLEIVRQGIVRVEQSQNFNDITLETDTITTPHYS